MSDNAIETINDINTGQLLSPAPIGANKICSDFLYSLKNFLFSNSSVYAYLWHIVTIEFCFHIILIKEDNRWKQII